MWNNFTYRADQSVDRGWHDVECRVNILVVLSHVQHHPFAERRRDALPLDRDAVFVDRGGHATVQHYVVLLVAAKENARCGQLVNRAIKVSSSRASNQPRDYFHSATTVVENELQLFFAPEADKPRENGSKCSDFYSRSHVGWEMVVEFERRGRWLVASGVE